MILEVIVKEKGDIDSLNLNDLLFKRGCTDKVVPAEEINFVIRVTGFNEQIFLLH